MRLSTAAPLLCLLFPVARAAEVAGAASWGFTLDDRMLRWVGAWDLERMAFVTPFPGVSGEKAIYGTPVLPGTANYTVDATWAERMVNETGVGASASNATPVATLEFDFVGTGVELGACIFVADGAWLDNEPVVYTIDGHTYDKSAYLYRSNGTVTRDADVPTISVASVDLTAASPTTGVSPPTHTPTTMVGRYYQLPGVSRLPLANHRVRLAVYDGRVKISGIQVTVPVVSPFHDHFQMLRFMPRTDEWAVVRKGGKVLGNEVFKVDGHSEMGTITALDNTYDYLRINGTALATIPPRTGFASLIGVTGAEFGQYNVTITPPPTGFGTTFDAMTNKTSNSTDQASWTATQSSGPHDSSPGLAQMFFASLDPNVTYTLQVASDGGAGINALHLWSSDGRNDSAWSEFEGDSPGEGAYIRLLPAIIVPTIVGSLLAIGVIWFLCYRRRCRRRAAQKEVEDGFEMGLRKGASRRSSFDSVEDVSKPAGELASATTLR